MTNRKAKSLSLVVFFILLGACTYQRQSIIDGSSSWDTDRYNWDVDIIAVDGVMLSYPLEYVNLEPGLHELLLRTTGPTKNRQATAQYFTITVKNCTKYYLSAQHERIIRSENWQVRVLREELIEYCNTDTNSQQQEE